MDLGLKGKVAIVGGGSMGIGYGIANRLAAEGADLVIFARRVPKLEAAAAELSAKHGVRVVPVSADIRNQDESGRIVQTALDHFGKLDILVNNDGAPPLGRLTRSMMWPGKRRSNKTYSASFEWCALHCLT